MYIRNDTCVMGRFHSVGQNDILLAVINFSRAHFKQFGTCVTRYTRAIMAHLFLQCKMSLYCLHACVHVLRVVQLHCVLHVCCV